MISRYQYEILSFLEKGGKQRLNYKNIADSVRISRSKTKDEIKELINNGLVSIYGNLITMADCKK